MDANGKFPLSYTSTNGGQSWSLSSQLLLPDDKLQNNQLSALTSCSCDNTWRLCIAVGAYKNNNGFALLSYTSSNGGVSWQLSNNIFLPTDAATTQTNSRFQNVC